MTEELTYEKALEKLDEKLKLLEDGDLSLEDALKAVDEVWFEFPSTCTDDPPCSHRGVGHRLAPRIGERHAPSVQRPLERSDRGAKAGCRLRHGGSSRPALLVLHDADQRLDVGRHLMRASRTLGGPMHGDEILVARQLEPAQPKAAIAIAVAGFGGDDFGTGGRHRVTP